MSETLEKDLYQSSDISLCAALSCYGYVVEGIERQPSGKATFLIEKNNEINNVIKRFFNHQLKVDALSYFNFLKELKTRIYNT